MYDTSQVFAKALNKVDHMGLTGEISFDGDKFSTDFQLDLMEKYRGRLRKTGNGINYTLTASAIGTPKNRKACEQNTACSDHTGKKLKPLFL